MKIWDRRKERKTDKDKARCRVAPHLKMGTRAVHYGVQSLWQSFLASSSLLSNCSCLSTIIYGKGQTKQGFIPLCKWLNKVKCLTYTSGLNKMVKLKVWLWPVDWKSFCFENFFTQFTQNWMKIIFILWQELQYELLFRFYLITTF